MTTLTNAGPPPRHACRKVEVDLIVRYQGKKYRCVRWVPPVTFFQKRHFPQGEWELYALEGPGGAQAPANDVYCYVDDNRAAK